MAKRVFDLVFAATGLVIASPVFLAVWILIKCDDGGPVFYRQIRVGKNGRPFRIVKFRSMSVGADRAGPSITASGDRRITRLGKFLRGSKLDELPQLWNVLWGDMSFVGPRPEVPRYVALYTKEQRAVLALKPGITDEASLAFRNEEQLLAAAPDREGFYIETCIPAKLALNLAYAREATVWKDIGLIGRTIGAVWLRR